MLHRLLNALRLRFGLRAMRGPMAVPRRPRGATGYRTRCIVKDELRFVVPQPGRKC